MESMPFWLLALMVIMLVGAAFGLGILLASIWGVLKEMMDEDDV